MAFFDFLKKKECDICGGEIGLLGNRKLEDGNMCKECAAKLSPWFDDRRNSTVEQINEQLEYREANKAKVAAFNTTRVFGESKKIFLDEDARLFMVTSADTAREKEEANPDVLSFSDVVGVITDIDEEEREIMREDKDGNEVSYTPKRYTYYYDFNVTIQVNNPYFDDMKFQLNNSTLELEQTSFRKVDPNTDEEYIRYKEMQQEIKEALLQVRQDVRDEAAAAAAPKQAVTCPHCSATTIPDANGCCEFCGGAV